MFHGRCNMHRSNAVIVPMHAGFNDDVVVPAGYEHDRPSWQPHHAYCIVSFLKRIIADWQTSVVCQLLLACQIPTVIVCKSIVVAAILSLLPLPIEVDRLGDSMVSACLLRYHM